MNFVHPPSSLIHHRAAIAYALNIFAIDDIVACLITQYPTEEESLLIPENPVPKLHVERK